jgi:hypothetical protein
MKRVFLLIVVPALLVAMGFAQVPAASSNADPMNVKGCLGGSDGNYTVLENSTGKTFKITTSSADLKAFVGQDVNITGHKEGTAEDGLAVTALNMISVHCAAAAVAPAAAASAPAETISTPPTAAAATVSAPAETVSAPDAATAPAAAAPAAAAPDATVSSPPETVIERPSSAAPADAPPAAAPAATVSTPQEPISTPPAAASAPAVSAPAETASAPATAAAVHRTPASAGSRKPAATPVAAPAPAEPVTKPVADAAVPTEPVAPPPTTASTAVAPAAAPATTASTSRSVGMIVSIVVVVLLIGAGVPLYNRWKRQKLLNETSSQNLSFTKERKPEPGKTDTTGGRKAA